MPRSEREKPLVRDNSGVARILLADNITLGANKVPGRTMIQRKNKLEPCRRGRKNWTQRKHWLRTPRQTNSEGEYLSDMPSREASKSDAKWPCSIAGKKCIRNVFSPCPPTKCHVKLERQKKMFFTVSCLVLVLSLSCQVFCHS